MTTIASTLPMEKIAEFCDDWQVVEFARFETDAATATAWINQQLKALNIKLP